MRRTLVLMVKEPRPGRVKTRLARDIGTVPAAWWTRRQTAATIRRLRDPRWDLVLAVAPDTALGARVWPAGPGRVAQGRGDLGQRMLRLLRMPARGPVVLIGSDIPDVRRRHIAAAFRALGRADAVFGPAEDGGFWLVGVKRVRAVPPALFSGVRWSGPQALSDTLETLAGMTHGRVAQLRDVDTAADLAAFRHDGKRGP